MDRFIAFLVVGNKGYRLATVFAAAGMTWKGGELRRDAGREANN